MCASASARVHRQVEREHDGGGAVPRWSQLGGGVGADGARVDSEI